jgi:hypothetical protein
MNLCHWLECNSSSTCEHETHAIGFIHQDNYLLPKKKDNYLASLNGFLYLNIVRTYFLNAKQECKTSQSRYYPQTVTCPWKMTRSSVLNHTDADVSFFERCRGVEGPPSIRTWNNFMQNPWFSPRIPIRIFRKGLHGGGWVSLEHHYLRHWQQLAHIGDESQQFFSLPHLKMK